MEVPPTASAGHRISAEEGSAGRELEGDKPQRQSSAAHPSQPLAPTEPHLQVADAAVAATGSQRSGTQAHRSGPERALTSAGGRDAEVVGTGATVVTFTYASMQVVGRVCVTATVGASAPVGAAGTLGGPAAAVPGDAQLLTGKSYSTQAFRKP